MTQNITVTFTISIPDGASVGTPAVDYHADEPPLPGYPADMQPVAAVGPFPSPVVGPVPQCPAHGPMTFHPTKKDGTPMPRYSCDEKVGTGWCPTKAVFIK